LQIIPKANRIMIDANLAIEVYVLEKSMPLVCAKPFATNYALYLSI